MSVVKDILVNQLHCGYVSVTENESLCLLYGRQEILKP